MNPFEAISTFKNMVQAQQGQNFNPEQMAQNMLGQNCSSPRQALDFMLRTGKINQQQYDTFVKML